MNNAEAKKESIKFFRLANGDDIVAELRGSVEGKITIKYPMRVLVDADLDVGRQTIYLHAWMPQGVARGDTCDINSTDVVFTSEVEDDIIKYYNGMVSELNEEIKVPDKKVSKGEKIISFQDIKKDKN